MTPYNRQISGTPSASIALLQSEPGSQPSTPAATTPNYFGNAGPRGLVGGMGVNRGMGRITYVRHQGWWCYVGDESVT